MDYFNDIFYDTKDLSIDQKKELCHKAKEVSYNWHADKIEGWQRLLDPSADFEETLNRLNDKCYFKVIHRRGYDAWNHTGSWSKWRGEIAIRFDNDKFLWIQITEDEFNKLIEPYNFDIL